MSNYLAVIPKDVLRIIYKYLYDYVPKELNKVVQRIGGYPIKRYHSFANFLGDLDHAALRSSICKICNYKLNVSHRVRKWYRPENPHINFLGNPENNCVCSNLIKSQDTEGAWDKMFNRKHQISIINGCVYHLASMGETSKKYNLVPYFQSDYCWQDLASRFLRNGTINQNSKEMDECFKKNDHQNRIITRALNTKKSQGTVRAECIVC